MEQQFILRLPDSLKNVDPKECKLNKVNSKEVTFTVKNNTYPGVICKLPTIVESQKLVENKLYKISDISTIVVIFENKGFNVDDEVFKIESSGLTPPMSFVKERRFAKNSIRSEEVERIEKKVQSLLAEDLKALKVEISNSEKESSDADLDMLAAELEDELALSKPSKSSSPREAVKENAKASATFKPSISPETISSNNVPLSPRTKTVPQMPSASTKKKEDVFTEATSFDTINLHSNLNQVEMPDISIPNNTVQIEKPKSETLQQSPTTVATDMNVVKDVQDKDSKEPMLTNENVQIPPELLELQKRIEEKQQQYDKAVNPILKKRFEQALQSLKEEYEKKRSQLQ